MSSRTTLFVILGVLVGLYGLTTAYNRTTEPSLGYKLAAISADAPPTDAQVATMDAILDSLASKCGRSRQDIADTAVAAWEDSAQSSSLASFMRSLDSVYTGGVTCTG